MMDKARMLGLCPGVKLLIMVYTYVSKMVPSSHSNVLGGKKDFSFLILPFFILLINREDVLGKTLFK